MSQHIPSNPTQNHHHHQLPSHLHHPTYIHYAAPVTASLAPQNHAVAPQDTTHQPLQSHSSPPTQPTLPQHLPPQQHHHLTTGPTGNIMTNGSPPNPGPLVATGDWTKDLVHLAKTAELKKHALTLQLHTAHILSANATLEQKNKTIQDIREQRNKLDSERTRLLNSLREINEDRDKADLMEASINKECEDLRKRIDQLTEGEYTAAKNDVDRLRHELGQSPLPSLQATLEERKTQYLNERRLNAADPALITIKRTVSTDPLSSGKRPRGRPKGSKNRAKSGATSEAPPASSS